MKIAVDKLINAAKLSTEGINESVWIKKAAETKFNGFC